MQAVDNAWHIFSIVDVCRFRKEDLGQTNELHGIEPMIYIVGVSKLQAVAFVLRLILVVDLLVRNFLRTKEVGELGQVDTIAKVILALGRRRQFFAYTRFYPSLMREKRKVVRIFQIPIMRIVGLLFSLF